MRMRPLFLTAALVWSTTATSAQNMPGNTAVQNPQASQTGAASSAASGGQNSQPQLNQQVRIGPLEESHQHRPGLIRRALGGVVSDAGQATMALIGTTILNQSPDLPPDMETNPEWPFREPHRKAIFTVNWVDGSTAKVSRLPDGSWQILGGGRRIILQPIGGGSFAMTGDYGNMATMSPRPGGGFTILRADGTVQQVIPREGGGFTVSGNHGVTATILPGMAGGKNVIRGGNGMSSGFIQ